MSENRAGKKVIIRRIALIALLCVFITSLSLLTGVFAKYMKELRSVNNQIRANDFYFTIDILGDTNEYTQLSRDINLYGTDSKTVFFTVQNYFDDLRINDEAIKYTVAASCDNDAYTAYSLTGAASGTLPASAQTNEVYTLSIPAGYASTDGTPTTVTVTVKSSSPYTKTMKLNFILNSSEADVTYRVEDNAGDAYATLIVMAGKAVNANAVTVDWSAVNATANVLQVDSVSKNILDSNVTLTTNDTTSYLKSATITKALAKQESVKIVFFKTDPTKNYSTNGDISAQESNGKYTVTINENTND